MTYARTPINKAYDDDEQKSAAGAAGGELSPAASSALDKKARLWHKRGRFKLPDTFYKKLDISYDLNEFGVFVETSRVEDEFKYYEKVEVTEDTFRNPRYKPPKDGKDPKAIRDDGGDFTHYIIEYRDVKTEIRDWHLVSETLKIDRTGQLWLNPPLDFEHEGIKVSESIKPPETDLDLSGIGPRLWKEMNPTKPAVGLGVNIAEIKDFPRLVKGKLDSLKSLVRSVSNPKGLADWFLAIQFGWKPLLSDIRKCIKLYFSLESRINFLMRNGGVPLKRATPVREPVVTDEVLYEYIGPDNQGWMEDLVPLGSDPDLMIDRFTCKITLHKEVTERASGVFTYHLGDIPPTPAYLRLKLLGLIADEALMWEATRWSWLVDWFSNMGDIISNIEANLRDRVVSLYAYSQRRVVREYKFTCSNGFYDCEVTRVFDTKCRRKIDPFGLATEVTLSDLQLGILVALGLTRV
jgi:hypothetical protein